MPSAKSVQIKLERTIAASPEDAYAAWLDPKIPGTPFHTHDRLIADMKVDGLWYWLIDGNHHYGRFTEMTRGSRIQQTWVSFYTRGEETIVTVTFAKKGAGTLMTLTHAGFPDEKAAQAHKGGWTPMLDAFAEIFPRRAA